MTLAKIPSGTLLYKVYALSQPNTEKVHIGDLVMTSEFTSSYFGDRYLFFKHQDVRDDIKLRPEWAGDFDIFSFSKCPMDYDPEQDDS